jgi:hypothetical protein
MVDLPIQYGSATPTSVVGRGAGARFSHYHRCGQASTARASDDAPTPTPTPSPRRHDAGGLSRRRLASGLGCGDDPDIGKRLAPSIGVAFAGLLVADRPRQDDVITGLPLRGGGELVLGGELEGVDDAQDLVEVAPRGHRVDEHQLDRLVGAITNTLRRVAFWAGVRAVRSPDASLGSMP